ALDADPDGYARAKGAWLAHADRADPPPAVFANAALFVESAEPSIAEQLLLRARSRHPDRPWAVRLGRLYALAIAGATAPVSSSHIRILRDPDPQGAFATLARGTLRDTTDPVLLTSAGWFLARAPQLPSFDYNVHDRADWAATCLERAIVLEPTAIVAHTLLLHVRSQQEFARTPLW